MKAIRTFFVVALTGIFLSACGAASEPAATPFPESMKGYELYSWQDGNQWRYSILIGTNREKTLDEIKSADVTLSGIGELKSTLEQIPAGQYITWSSRETLSFPPEDILKRIQQACDEKGLILSIAL
jgi:hypothetical protein